MSLEKTTAILLQRPPSLFSPALVAVRLASGDADGGVVVWDVSTASPTARLEDTPSAREVMRDYRARTSSEGGAGGSGSLFPQTSGVGGTGGGAAATAGVGVASGSGVSCLAWVMPGSSVLAVVLAPALLLLWDVNSEWRQASQCTRCTAVGAATANNASGKIALLSVFILPCGATRIESSRCAADTLNTTQLHWLMT
jgi:WD40 repeat protein